VKNPGGKSVDAGKKVQVPGGSTPLGRGFDVAGKEGEGSGEGSIKLSSRGNAFGKKFGFGPKPPGKGKRLEGKGVAQRSTGIRVVEGGKDKLNVIQDRNTNIGLGSIGKVSKKKKKKISARKGVRGGQEAELQRGGPRKKGALFPKKMWATK